MADGKGASAIFSLSQGMLPVVTLECDKTGHVHSEDI